MIRVWSLVAALLASGCATLVPPPDAARGPSASPEAALAAYARVLEKFVDDRGWVDFPALLRDREDLETYVRFIADAPLDSFAPGEERLAHYINSYNALSMFNVIESGIPETHAGWHKVAFFALRRLVVGGRPLTLYAYENDVIRKVGDPRIHFALNCSAISCPALPGRPFAAQDLQPMLDRETRRFFASEDHLRIDHPNKVVNLSEILRFYREDFVSGQGSLIGFVNRYAPEKIPETFEIRFIPYDWRIANSFGRRNP